MTSTSALIPLLRNPEQSVHFLRVTVIGGHPPSSVPGLPSSSPAPKAKEGSWLTLDIIVAGPATSLRLLSPVPPSSASPPNSPASARAIINSRWYKRLVLLPVVQRVPSTKFVGLSRKMRDNYLVLPLNICIERANLCYQAIQKSHASVCQNTWHVDKFI